MPPSVGIELLPEWLPSRAPDVASFDTLVKAGPGHMIEDFHDLRVRLLDEAGGVVDTLAPAYDTEGPSLQGPAWRVLRGRLLKIDHTVSQAEGVLAGMRSRRVTRSDGREPLQLIAIRDVVGAEREPHLWWRFYNASDEPLSVRDVRASTFLWLDEQRLPLDIHYNGPAMLPPERAMSGLWSLGNNFPASGEHRARLQTLGRFSNEVILPSA